MYARIVGSPSRLHFVVCDAEVQAWRGREPADVLRFETVEHDFGPVGLRQLAHLVLPALVHPLTICQSNAMLLEVVEDLDLVGVWGLQDLEMALSAGTEAGRPVIRSWIYPIFREDGETAFEVSLMLACLQWEVKAAANDLVCVQLFHWHFSDTFLPHLRMLLQHVQRPLWRNQVLDIRPLDLLFCLHNWDILL